MPLRPAPPPGDFALALNAAIRAEMGAQRVTGKELAARIGRSQNYVSMRLRDEFGFNLDDLAFIAEALGMDPAELLAGR